MNVPSLSLFSLGEVSTGSKVVSVLIGILTTVAGAGGIMNYKAQEAQFEALYKKMELQRVMLSDMKMNIARHGYDVDRIEDKVAGHREKNLNQDERIRDLELELARVVVRLPKFEAYRERQGDRL